MKLLNVEQMISLVEGASDAAILAAQAAIPKSSRDLADDWLVYAVKEGFMETAELSYLNEGIVATIFYSLDGRTLRLNAVHSRRPDLDLEDAIEVAARRLAGDKNALRVQFETKRGGAIRKAVRRGYEISGVILRRTITGAPSGTQQRPQDDQQQQSGPSESKPTTTTTETASNQQVGESGGGVALGAGSSGNTINVVSSDVDALNANQAVTGYALEAGADETQEGIAANVQTNQDNLSAGIANLQTAAAVAQMGLATGAALGTSAIASNTQITGEAIAGNTDVANHSIDSSEDVALASLAAGQNIGALGLADGQQNAELVAKTSTDDLDAALGGAVALTAGSQQTESDVVNSALNAVLTGQANSNSLIQSVVNSNTTALENSNTLAYETAAGATSQEGQIAGAALGDQSVSSFSAQPLDSVNGGTSPVVLVTVAGVALLAFFFLFKD